MRDPVGDLNAEAVRSGTFDGAILLPGTQVSLAVGGFVTTAAMDRRSAPSPGEGNARAA